MAAKKREKEFREFERENEPVQPTPADTQRPIRRLMAETDLGLQTRSMPPILSLPGMGSRYPSRTARPKFPGGGHRGIRGRT